MNFLFLILISLTGFKNYQPTDAVIGEYWTNNKEGKIAIYKCDNKYCGRIIWRKENILDAKNPDKSKRNRRVVGIDFLENFQYDGKKNKWTKGSVYSIENGKTYKGKMWLEDGGNTLKMRGFVGVSILGKTASFERVN